MLKYYSTLIISCLYGLGRQSIFQCYISGYY